MKWFTLLVGLSITALTVHPSQAQASPRGIEGQKAPEWAVSEWVQLQGKKAPTLKNSQGKVLYLFFFQSWCPGCNSHGFPTMKAVQKNFASNPNVKFVTIQTVFEGFWVNSNEKAKSTAESFGLRIPVGHDAGPTDEGSITMRRYRSGGTPWTVIIDRNGVVRFNGFRMSPSKATGLIRELLKK